MACAPHAGAVRWPGHEVRLVALCTKGPCAAVRASRPRRRALLCQAAKDASVAVRERSGISKLDEPPNSLVEDFVQPIFSPATLVPVVLGTGGAFALGLGNEGLALGAALGGVLRIAQLLFLQQEVPFTERKHSLLLPVGIELQMGSAIFHKQVSSANSQSAKGHT